MDLLEIRQLTEPILTVVLLAISVLYVASGIRVLITIAQDRRPQLIAVDMRHLAERRAKHDDACDTSVLY